MISDQLTTEARAKIIWGEEPASVRDFLISNGIPSKVADAKIGEFVRERNQELRVIGVRDILVGFVLFGTVSVATWACARHFIFTSGFVKLYAGGVLVGAYGFWRLVKGISYLVRPQAEHKSIADIELEGPLG
jgi:hypothetical protein